MFCLRLAAAVLFGSSAFAEMLIAPAIIPLENSQAYIFAAPLSEGTPARLFVLDGHELRIYDVSRPQAPLIISLPAATTAVDVRDITGDGIFDVLVVAGTKVLVRSLAPAESNTTWREVLDRSSLYSDTAALPFPQVLLIEREDAIAITLPQIVGFEIWSLDRVLLETLSYDQLRDRVTIPPVPFQIETMPAVVGGIDTKMVHAINSQRDPGPPTEADSNADGSRPVTAMDVSELPSDQWPSFPLRSDDAFKEVLFAPVPPRFEDTYVRLRSLTDEAVSRSGTGPARRYPGRILTGQERLPDFNRDGFVDLVCWKRAGSGVSLSGLTGILRDATWQAQLSVHLYNPTTGLFDAEPSTLIRVRLPLPWFDPARQGSPIRNLLFSDLDRDGLLDVGLSIDQDTYGIWSQGPQFEMEQAYTIRAAGPMESIVRDIDVGAVDSNTLILRGPNALYVARIPNK